MSTLESVEQIMRQSKTVMSVREIVDLAGDSLPTRSRTPETVVARDLSVNIKKLGEESRFVRTAPGRYTLREFVHSGLIAMGEDVDATKNCSNTATPVLKSALQEGPSGVLPSTSASVGSTSSPVVEPTLRIVDQHR